MKKISLLLLTVFLVATTNACVKPKDTGRDPNAGEHSSSTSEDSAGQEEEDKDTSKNVESTSSSEEEKDVSEFPITEIDTNTYYVEAVELKSDPGDNKSAQESAKTAWDTLKETNASDFTEAPNVFISLNGIQFIENEDRYLYTVGIGTEFQKNDYKALYDVSVNYLGDVTFLTD